ncbi:MAG: ATP-dependent Clp protease ATP-binding subunit [Patescibacteria group bacterium]
MERKDAHGITVVVGKHGNGLLWGRVPSDRSRHEAKLERMVLTVVNGTLLAFGIVGLGLGFWQFYESVNIGGTLQEWFDLKNGPMSVFWLSLFTDLYLIYRFDREMHRIKRLDAFSYAQFTVGEPLTREEIAKDKNLIHIEQYFSQPAHDMVEEAWLLAKRFHHVEVMPLHLLAASLQTKNGSFVMTRLGISQQQLVEKIGRQLEKFPRGEHRPVLSVITQRLLVHSFLETLMFRQDHVQTEEIILAISETESIASEVLFDLSVDTRKLHNVIEWMYLAHRHTSHLSSSRLKASHRSKSGMNKAMTAIATPLLDRFGNDMTDLARRGMLSAMVGRDDEFQHIFEVLSQRQAMPLLVGDPGVGKQAILEGLAQRMAAEEVPEFLRDMRLISLSVAKLVSGAAAMGELEQRMESILFEATRSGNIILIIENMQNIVGLSSAGGSSLDVAELLSNHVQRYGQIVIGTTTPTDYRRVIEGHALEGVFERILVGEPDTDLAIRIVQARTLPIEAKYRVFFSYDAVEKIVELSIRYIHDHLMPEKAIRLTEDVAQFVRRERGQDMIVSGEDVAKVISKKTKVQVAEVTKDEREKLLHLEDEIHSRLINQEEAVSAVAKALRRARTELRDEKRPIASLLFLGPTGVGKTELAKTLAEVYFGSEENMTRLDMSEYQDVSSIARLLGAPTGYAGAGEGQLTQAVRAKPFSLVLLDELEKAHPDILNLFLQVMDDGRLTDGTGRTVDFTNVIIIATSNAGTPVIQQRVKEGIGADAIKEELMNVVLGKYYRPEFLNRFDNIVVFTPLSPEHIVQVARLLIGKVQAQLADRGITLEVTDEALVDLAERGFDPAFGARPLRRLIQDEVDDALAKFLLTGNLGRRDIAVLEKGGQVSVKHAEEL